MLPLPTRSSLRPDAGAHRRFGALFCLGLVGVIAASASAVAGGGLPAPLAELHPALVLALVSIQPAVFLGVAVAVGLVAAPRVGLKSRVRELADGDGGAWAGFRSELRPALGLGGIAGVALLLAGWLVGPAGSVSGEGATVRSVLAAVPLRFLYGGITEELLLRWGLMSALAAIGRRMTGGARGELTSGVAWAAILASAVLFGFGHLPTAVTLYGSLTPSVVAFVVLGNSLGGVAYGWLYWRHSLEAAMVGHAATHVVFVAVSLALVAA
ncbi:CPBP family intramembrane glutamic endopeptidase [Halobaculum roseum]|uniref:CPBP family intramembrane glutamic endopeptidase n=1 Tax=Halobaculum roseum TaxID=2175149 RepID=A0ABD5MVV9_9EURY|nr:CPBP family intramembrane glutamic endopeptidase [Halobaculum roseum]QZY04471.1 CPBP family intramembrane metalloprotease [Halobaculum roseum]